MIIAHIDHTDERGGAELALARLLQAEPGWTPRLFLPPSTNTHGEAFDEVDSAIIHRVGIRQPAGAISRGLLSKFSLLSRVLYQACAIRAHHAFRDSEVVHANTSRSALIGLLACTWSRRRLIVHLRDSIEPDALGSMNARLLGYAVSRADGIVANSAYTIETARRYLPADTSTFVVPSPVGLSEQRTVKPPRKDVHIIGMLARLTQWKGQDLLMRAFAASFGGTAVRLELAGSSAFGNEQYFTQLEMLAHELNIADQVRFLGHVTDIWPLLDSWDICVHASTRAEPLGQNVLQYLAAGRPTIAAAAGGPAEWIRRESNGLLFTPGDVEDLSCTLERLAGDWALRQRLSTTLISERPVPTDANIGAQFLAFFESVARPRR